MQPGLVLLDRLPELLSGLLIRSRTAKKKRQHACDDPEWPDNADDRDGCNQDRDNQCRSEFRVFNQEGDYPWPLCLNRTQGPPYLLRRAES